MKQVYLIVALLAGSFSCTDKQAAEKGPHLPVIDHPERVEIRKSFGEVPIDNSDFCADPAGNSCVHTYQLLLAQLMILDPIPVPQSTLGPAISTAEAIDLYKSFVSHYRGEPILAVFKQLYPRILLNKYGILEGSDFAQISYFAQQLIEAKSYDHAILLAALKKLKPHSSPGQFSSMKASTLEATQRRRSLLEAEISELSDTTATGRYGDELSTRLFPKDIRAQILARNKSEYRNLLTDLDELNKL
ncbi:hypothetical protein [Fibrella forsythiae]|uniref:Uncharacterized protein n=1 Tax=Fibrella forsythiae TaxID=2817061 RepID=A0ABS3JAR1_9BACT|nr:hypothetical protein [Fibrella forsythiae]MBO0947064.1 hypothetical protein [Fibrella forsythiae]